MMFAARRLRQFSTRTAPPRQEYPTSFISHLRTQKLNVFNIGVAFLTLSLSSQLVSYKQKLTAATAEREQLAARVDVLETLVVELGGTVPADDAVATAAAVKAEQDKQQQQQRERDEEVKVLAAMTAAATGASPSSDDKGSGKSSGAKGMLI